MRAVRFIKPHLMYQVGEVAGFADREAAALITAGKALDKDAPGPVDPRAATADRVIDPDAIFAAGREAARADDGADPAPQATPPVDKGKDAPSDDAGKDASSSAGAPATEPGAPPKQGRKR